MRSVYEAANPIDAHPVRCAPGHAGVAGCVRGEALAGGLDEPPARAEDPDPAQGPE